ncbi:reverse transcriptase domain-containing protein [Tanacetum coccineum]
MMTTEYCPTIEIQKIEQELWTLTMKGDDIEGYKNRFHELALMCPDLVTPEKKKIERYIRGLPERVKANVSSSKPASLHDAINMARELIEQAIKAKATRIGSSFIKIDIIGDDQIDSNIIYDEPNEDVNSGSVEYDNNDQKSYELEQLARNAYKEAEKQ